MPPLLTGYSLPERTRRRVIFYLIPFLFFLYILAYLDRTNVSVAMGGMIKHPWEGGLGFTKLISSFGMGLFFWGYWILEIPSTQSVLTLGARWVFVRILILWGMACLLIGFIGLGWFNDLFHWLPGVLSWPFNFLFPHQAGLDLADNRTVASLLVAGPGAQFATSPFALYGWGVPPQPDDHVIAQFYFLRFMLGFFEGGFFPAVIMYLSIWFRPRDRGRAIATFMAAIPVAGLVGTPFSQFLLGQNWLGLPGWRWIFFIQGFVPILAGIATIWFLPDRPEKARWLPPEEKDWLVGELARDQAARTGHGHGWGGQVGIVLLLTVYYFCINVASYGYSQFLPDLLKTQSGLPENVAGYLAGLPYLFGLIGMLINGWHSDRTGERVFHTAVPLTVVGIGMLLAAGAVYMGQGWLAAIFLGVLVGSCLYAHLPAFWSLPTIFMGATAAAAAIGFINMIGNLGGSVGPTVLGAAADRKAYDVGLAILGVFPLVAVVVILSVRYLRLDRLRASREAHLSDQAGVVPGEPGA
jgi:ACS family tartrate transporter-like MFS transporter